MKDLPKRVLEYSDRILSFPKSSEEKFNYALDWANAMMKDFPKYYSDWKWIIRWALNGLGEIEEKLTGEMKNHKELK